MLGVDAVDGCLEVFLAPSIEGSNMCIAKVHYLIPVESLWQVIVFQFDMHHVKLRHLYVAPPEEHIPEQYDRSHA